MSKIRYYRKSYRCVYKSFFSFKKIVKLIILLSVLLPFLPFMETTFLNSYFVVITKNTQVGPISFRLEDTGQMAE